MDWAADREGKRVSGHRPEVLWCPNGRRGGRGDGWAFPRGVEKLLRAETEGKSVLHLFGGKAQWGVRLDIDPATRPHVIGDAWLPPFAEASFDVVILDPPYNHINAQMKNALLRGAAFCSREFVVWFSTLWIAGAHGLKLERSWLVRVGDHCYVRGLQVFRVTKRLTPTRMFTRGPAMKYNRWLMQPQGLPFPIQEGQR
jgi:hypothetical protein